MRKVKSLDQYYFYKIEKNDGEYSLGNELNYKEHIKDLLKNLEGLKFDSFIIIFGLDTGAYIDELKEVLCERNRVLIFEPNEEIFNENSKLDLGSNISIILFDEETVNSVLCSVINGDNFDNLYVHDFGNYKKVYREEYDELIKNIDSIYFSIIGNITLAYRCKESFMRNSIANLRVIKEATPLNPYVELNKDVPAIIVSAGPSLDKNIEDMVRNIDKVKEAFIIASNRTFTTLINRGIVPDLVVSIDPSDAMYDMMKDSINEKVPLLFYEYSNRYLLKHYKGEKIYVSNIFSKIIKGMNMYGGLSQGGSVAHTCLSMANILGCNPIILVGQDFAYTNDKHHAQGSTFSIDDGFKYINADRYVKDVFGNDVKTTNTLLVFKDSMEIHIEKYMEGSKVKFINASYGADIKGAPHRELEEVLKEDIFKKDKKSLKPNKCIELDAEEIVASIINYIDEFIEKSEQGMEQCNILAQLEEEKSLVNINEEDIDFQRFLFILDIVNVFESSLESFYLGGYFNKFMYAIKRESFSMLAKDYKNLTSNMRYQGRAFYNYFKRMNEMLIEAKKILEDEVSNFE